MGITDHKLDFREIKADLICYDVCRGGIALDVCTSWFTELSRYARSFIFLKAIISSFELVQNDICDPVYRKFQIFGYALQ